MEWLVRDGRVLADGFPVRNPRSLVRRDASLVISGEPLLRGERKLSAALRIFDLDVCGRVALDIGAAAGGFTRALLSGGAARVYAVDAGHGQLLGSLRQDIRVVNLERTNLGELDRRLVPDCVQVITIDVSYLSLATALPQLDAIDLADGAHLVALVKPQFELGLAHPPDNPEQLRSALAQARSAIERAGWRVVGDCEAPVRGGRGAVEFFVHARRQRRRRAAC